MNEINKDQFSQIMGNRAARITLARESHFWFFHMYLSHYVKSPTADFQKELFRITEDQTIKNAVIVAFRGSAKSTIMGLSYPLWAILGKQQKKFVLILSQTQNQAQQMLINIKREIEANEILRNDFGALDSFTDEWARDSLVIKSHNARIMAASTETSIRGIRHGEFRPDLIICDDVENIASVKTRDGRNKTYGWWMGDIIPAGDQETRSLIIGNLLHEDSLLMRLKRDIENNRLDGEYRSYPLLDENGNCLWPGKYPNDESIDQLKKKISSEISWQREYLLRIIADQEQVVHPSWIHYYEELPKEDGRYQATCVGVDLAISKNETADYTAMVTARVYDYSEKLRIYILPNPTNERLTFPEQVERIKLINKSRPGILVYIEEVGYQTALVQQLWCEGFSVEGVKVYGQDKRARLAILSHLIQTGQVLFPKTGCEELISQLTNFGIEAHDDLADAYSLLVHKIIEKFMVPMRISW